MRSKVKPLNGYTGYVYEEYTHSGIITRASTYPFRFLFTREDAVTPLDVGGYTVYLAFATSLTCLAQGALELEVMFTPDDPMTGIIAGEISDDETYSLPVGRIFSSAKYILPDGRSYTFDMARLQIGECISSRRDQ